MNISITVPDDLAHQMGDRWEDLPRQALEALAAATYRSGILTAAQVRRLLGHESRFETQAFPDLFGNGDLTLGREFAVHFLLFDSLLFTS